MLMQVVHLEPLGFKELTKLNKKRLYTGQLEVTGKQLNKLVNPL
jgi:hypothetical protein